jgi:hypothetical protein
MKTYYATSQAVRVVLVALNLLFDTKRGFIGPEPSYKTKKHKGEMKCKSFQNLLKILFICQIVSDGFRS